jgi:hypothetical protein
MVRAFVGGLIVVGVVYAAYALASQAVRESDAVTWLASLTPGVAAFAVAWRAPRKKVLMGLSMMPTTACIAAMTIAIDYWRGGATDFPGARGALAVIEFVLATSAIPALVGSVIAYVVTKRLDAKAAQNPKGAGR